MKKLRYVLALAVLGILTLPGVAADLEVSWNAVAVESANNVGANPSISKITNTEYVMSYQDVTGVALRWAYSSNSGISWLTGDIDSTDRGPSDIIGLSSTQWIAAWVDATSGLDLKFSRTTNSGTSWTTVTVDNPGSVGTFSLKAITSTIYIIAYTDSTNTDAKVAKSSDSGATWTPTTVETNLVDSVSEITVIDTATYFFGLGRGGNLAARMCKTDNGGTSWTCTGDLAGTTNVVVAAGTAYRAGVWYVAIGHCANPEKRIALYISADGGASFSAHSDIYQNDGAGAPCPSPGALEFDAEGILHHTYDVSTTAGVPALGGVVTKWYINNDDVLNNPLSNGEWDIGVFNNIMFSGAAGAEDNSLGTFQVIESGVYISVVWDEAGTRAMFLKSELTSGGPGPIGTTGDIIGDLLTLLEEAWGFSWKYIVGLFLIGGLIWKVRDAQPLVVGIIAFIGVIIAMFMLDWETWILFVLIFLIIAVAGQRLFGGGESEDE